MSRPAFCFELVIAVADHGAAVRKYQALFGLAHEAPVSAHTVYDLPDVERGRARDGGVAIELRSASCIWLSGNWTLCEASVRMPPMSSLSGSASALNLIW